jgi:uncharacterized membrane protein (UPF0127 family)
VRRLLVLGLLVAPLLAACSSENGSTARASSTGTTVAPPSSTAVPKGFDAIVLRVTDANGATHEWCVLVADTEAKRQRGLMDVDNLGGYDGMIFRFDAPTTAQFYMFHTRLPLSVAFFAAGGSFVSATDMAPCTASRGSDCELYRAGAPYVDALEVPMGGLGALGIAAGSTISTGPACSRTG